MRLLIPLLALLAAGLAPLSPTAVATADPLTCEGRTATIVGNGHDPVEGTAGDDVIVSNGSSVYAGDGSDLVCMTHVHGKDTQVYDDTGDPGLPPGSGDGDDVVRVLSSSPDAVVTVFLAGGDDRFVGGPERDKVLRLDLGEPVVAGGDDVVRTGGGDDWVQVGDGYEPGSPIDRPGTDRVHLGAGNDFLDVRPPSLAHALVWDGGSGVDRLGVWTYGQSATLDLAVRRVAFAGASFSGFAGFESYAVDGSRVTIRGSADDDTVYTLGSVWTHARLGAGDDVLESDPRNDGPITARGQAGDDVLAGSHRRDLLVGGHGFDVAHGGAGVDTCRTERSTRCERMRIDGSR